MSVGTTSGRPARAEPLQSVPESPALASAPRLEALGPERGTSDELLGSHRVVRAVKDLPGSFDHSGQTEPGDLPSPEVNER